MKSPKPKRSSAAPRKPKDRWGPTVYLRTNDRLFLIEVVPDEHWDGALLGLKTAREMHNWLSQYIAWAEYRRKAKGKGRTA